MRALGAIFDGSKDGIFTDRVDTLSDDVFVNLTSNDYEWRKADEDGMTFTLEARDGGGTRFTATRCDLVFGSNAQLRSVAEVYAGHDGEARFVNDFVAVWDKVMMLDRFDYRNA